MYYSFFYLKTLNKFDTIFNYVITERGGAAKSSSAEEEREKEISAKIYTHTHTHTHIYIDIKRTAPRKR